MVTNQARQELTVLRASLRDLVEEWRRRATAADRGGMPQIAMDYTECADELLLVARGRWKQ